MIRPFSRFQRIEFTDPDMRLLVDRIAAAFDQTLAAQPAVIQQVAVGSGSNLVSHGLGRNYVTWWAGNWSTPMRLSYGKSPDPLQFINVVSDASGTVDIVVM